MTRVILPSPHITHDAPHPALKILTSRGFAVSTAAADNDNTDPNTVKIHIYNSLTNRRGTESSLADWFARSAELAQELDLIDRDLNIQLTFSGARVERENSRLEDASWAQDQNYTKNFYDPTALEKKPDLVFVAGWEPESNTNPADILSDARAGQARKVIESAERENIPTVLSCRAAHLALTDLVGPRDGGTIELLPRKLKNVVAASVQNINHPITTGLEDTIRMPMSRLCAFKQSAMHELISSGEVQELAHSPDAGTIIAARGNTIYISGHPECRADDIHGEDVRDLDRDTKAGKKPEDFLGPTKNIEHANKAEHDGLLFCANVIKLAVEHREAVRNTKSTPQAVTYVPDNENLAYGNPSAAF